MTAEQDRRGMRAALAQAQLAAKRGEVPVGAVVVDARGRLLAQARNAVVRLADPTAHAELLALRAAAKRVRSERLVGATLYTTLEPCPMCAGAIVLARVARVVYGARDPKSGAAGSVANLLRHPDLNHRCQVDGPTGPAACGAILRGFFRKKRARARPGSSPKRVQAPSGGKG
jgi:tRNA(adenine34) deaminase